MAEFITKCPHCNSDLQVQDEWGGMEVECPMCKMKFVIERTATHHQPYNFLHKNKFWCIGGASVLAITIIVTIICLLAGNSKTETTAESVQHETETTAGSVQHETVASQKHRRDGVHFTFKWGYLIDDLAQQEFESLQQITNYGYVTQYNAKTQSGYQYTITVRNDSRKISRIISEDKNTIDAFIAEMPHILKAEHKVRENDNAACFFLDCAFGDVLLMVNKKDENKKVLLIEEFSARNDYIDRCFNVVLKSFGF